MGLAAAHMLLGILRTCETSRARVGRTRSRELLLEATGKVCPDGLVLGHMPLKIHVASAETLSPDARPVHYNSMNFALITYEIIDDKRLINLREI